MGWITVVGLGARLDELTLGAVDALKSAKVILRTRRHPVSDYLKQQGVAFESLDELYEHAEDFDELNRAALEVLSQAAKDQDVAYGVMDLRDGTVQALIEAELPIRIVPGVPAEGALMAMAGETYQTLAASDAMNFEPDPDLPCLVRELDNRIQTSEVKLRLMEHYPEEQPCLVSDPDGKIHSIKLMELDRLERYNHLSCALITAQTALDRLERYGYRHLNRMMRRLLDADGCPWDRAQTHETLKPYLVEEAYEVLDAIDRDDMDALYDELGDVLFQVAFHAEIARRHGEFDESDVTTAICRKMISRHRHVFGQAKADTPEQVAALWEQVKREEKSHASLSEEMREITRGLPALMRAQKTLKKAAALGLDLLDLLDWGEAPESEEERIGRALFELAGKARSQEINAELALDRAIGRFADRVERMEQDALRDGVALKEQSAQEMKARWKQAKIGGFRA